MVTDEKVFYHVWFGTKRRKWLLLGQIEDRIKELISEIAKTKGIDLLACETMVDHIHLLIRSTPDNLPKALFWIKGISSRQIFQSFPELKLEAGTENFWKEHYGCKVAPPEAIESIASYIATQKERPNKFE